MAIYIYTTCNKYSRDLCNKYSRPIKKGFGGPNVVMIYHDMSSFEIYCYFTYVRAWFEDCMDHMQNGSHARLAWLCNVLHKWYST